MKLEIGESLVLSNEQSVFLSSCFKPLEDRVGP